MAATDIKPYHTWKCLTCEGEPEFADLDGVRSHVTQVHGYKPGTQGKRNEVLHMDGRGWYRSDYKWDFGSFALGESLCEVRGK